MKQIALDLQLPEPFGFDDFLIGPNLEAFMALREMAAGTAHEPLMYLWGESGVGKTHLLRAAAAMAIEHGYSASYWDAAAEGLNESAHGFDLLAVDGVDALGSDEQIALFGLINAQRERGAAIVIAGHQPPARTLVREDLQTRLGYGLVYQILPPADEDKAALLKYRAAMRGCEIAEDVCNWLVMRSSRDLGSLTRLVDRLDRAALAAKRPLTLPFVRDVLRSEGDEA
ncbi:DnaA regulatory inactivator Hda [Burkholderiaceae bacterium DAT-1]|nr:DnaA regulatory inactivator Hda [Burkholderiaceae bacterium DAT-1]